MSPPYIIEIPSIEHPRLLAAALDESAQRSVPISRISQGSGSYALTGGELLSMVEVAHEHDIELFTFVNSRNGAASSVISDGAIWGEAAFSDAIDELYRCIQFGIDGVLIADVGLLARAGELSQGGALGGLKLKSAAAIAPRNAAAAELYSRLGASSINTASGSSLDELLAMRHAIEPDITLDIYIESPDEFGGGLRFRDLPAIVRDLAPVSLKIGLRNAPALYPYGLHLEPMATMAVREKVRRAELVLARLRETETVGHEVVR